MNLQLIKDMPQRSPEWFSARLSRITGTRADGLIGTPLAFQKLGYEITAEMLSTPRPDLEDMNPMERGEYLENEARAAVSLELGIPIYTVSMILGNSTMAFSPDGVNDDYDPEAITMVTELKCPMGTNHIKYIIEGGIPKDYLAQVVRPFTVLPNLEQVVFASYNPEITDYPLYIYKATRAELAEDIKKMSDREEGLNRDVEKYIKIIKSNN